MLVISVLGGRDHETDGVSCLVSLAHLARSRPVERPYLKE